jgi:hypothetical protein
MDRDKAGIYFFIYLFKMSQENQEYQENQNLEEKKEELLNDKKDLEKVD